MALQRYYPKLFDKSCKSQGTPIGISGARRTLTASKEEDRCRPAYSNEIYG